MIPAQTVDLVLQTAVIEDVVGEYVELKKSGSALRGLSPFTSEKTPSFYVLPEKGIFKCFSSDKGGSVVTFLMELEKWSFPETIRQLANRYGIEIEEEEFTPEQQEARSERESLLAVNEWVQKWFSSELHESKEGRAIGLSYFETRGFRADILEKFKIGYCPDAWDSMSTAALDAGYKLERLLALGLVKDTDGKTWDFFKGRVMFPIRDVTGRTIAFGGRTLKKDKQVAKYFNSPESPLYHKGDVLFGLHLAKPAITKEDRVYLVEGYTDVMAMHQAGIEHVVSSSGTALTVNQIKLIRRYTKNITVLFDGDDAGIRASLRGIDLLLAEGLNVQVVLFPDGDDPDSYSKKVSSEVLKTYLDEAAKDFVAFKMDLLSREAGDDPVKRSDMIHSILESIASIPDGIQQGVYVKLASEVLAMSEEMLQGEINKIHHQRIAEQQKAAKREAFRQRQISPRDSGTAGLFVPPDWSDADVPGSDSDSFGVIEPNRLKAHRQVLEFDLTRLLLVYGENLISVERDEVEDEVEDETTDDKSELTKVSFVELTLHYLESFMIEIQNELVREILDIFKSHYERDQIPNMSAFLTHPNPEVHALVVKSTIQKDHVSKRWEEVHQIYPAQEKDLLRKALMDALHHLKLNQNRQEIAEVQVQLEALSEALELGEPAAEAGLRTLLERRKQLDLQKKELARYFGMAILP